MINIVGKFTPKIVSLLYHVPFGISYKAGQTYRFFTCVITFVLLTCKTVERWLELPSVLSITVSKLKVRQWLVFQNNLFYIFVNFSSFAKNVAKCKKQTNDHFL